MKSPLSVEFDFITRWTHRAVITIEKNGFYLGHVGVQNNHPLAGVDITNLIAELPLAPDREELFRENLKKLSGRLEYCGSSSTYPVSCNLWWFGFSLPQNIFNNQQSLLKKNVALKKEPVNLLEDTILQCEKFSALIATVE